MIDNSNTVLFIPHGGGPLPLLNDKRHLEMVTFLQNFSTSMHTPSAIVIISAHWEADEVTITSGSKPELIYDYSGFPRETYEISYPAAGNPELAKEVQGLLKDNGINADLDDKRGFDHGMFVPLKLMYPEAQIPCIQISLVKGLDPKTHIQIGKALSALKDDNILVIGSGLSFHNMREFGSDETDKGNIEFEEWLIDTSTNPQLTDDEREQRLINWSYAPSAKYCHPREEHLIPLHVCAGMGQSPAKLVFDGKVLGKKTSAYLWRL